MLRRYAAAFVNDVRFGLRMMSRTPAFTAVALLMIALGTGANAAMFSVIDAVMLRTPFKDPDRIAIVRIVAPDKGPTMAVTLPQFRSLAESAPALEAIAALGSGRRPVLAGLGDTRSLSVECVTAGMFRVLGVNPIAGRTFTADEDRPGGPSSMVLSYDFWQRELGGSRDVVGRAVTLNGVPTTIVGIMPRRFLGPLSRNGSDAWLPLGPGLGQPSPVGCAAPAFVNVFARSAPGLTFEAAAAQSTASSGLERIPGRDGKTGSRLSLLSLEEQTFYELRTPLLTLLGAVGLVLLIACANVANLQLERIFGRRQELAVRLALGATGGRIVRQTLTENLLLYVMGVIGGFLLASWTLHLIVALMPGNIPHLAEIEINRRILAATFAVACVAGMAVGLVPALQARSPGLVEDLKTSSRTATRGGQWTRQALVAGQIALSLTLLVGAALMVRTFLTLSPSSAGFTFANKLTAFIRAQEGTREDLAPPMLVANVLERLRAIPGVQGVSGSTYLPMSGNVGLAAVRTEGADVQVLSGIVTPNYFSEMEIPIVRGRAFEDRDGPGATPVVIVNEAMVRRFWPAGEPLGSTITVTTIDRRSETRQVIGILRDTRSNGGDTRARPELYTPYAQTPYPSLNIIIRTANPSDPRLQDGVRAAVAAVDRNQVVDRFATLENTLDARVAYWRFGAWLLGSFAAMALLLAAVGLAASIAWWVAQRTREIGVRMALGANAGQVIRLFLRQGLVIGVSGIALGLAGAAASTRRLESWLYGVKPLDAPTFGWSAAGMLAIAALASYLPARRAARIDPLTTLRAE
jgi:putative ABC transport system permease protein